MEINILQNKTLQANALYFYRWNWSTIQVTSSQLASIKSTGYDNMIAYFSENYANFDGNRSRQNMCPQISLLQRKENKENPSTAPI